MSNGKGHAPRPLSVPRKEFNARFDAVFRAYEIGVRKLRDRMDEEMLRPPHKETDETDLTRMECRE